LPVQAVLESTQAVTNFSTLIGLPSVVGVVLRSVETLGSRLVDRQTGVLIPAGAFYFGKTADATCGVFPRQAWSP
jgi:hypothetical protein